VQVKKDAEKGGAKSVGVLRNVASTLVPCSHTVFVDKISLFLVEENLITRYHS